MLKKPMIGILMRCDRDEKLKRSTQYVYEGVRRAVIKSGGIPFLICPVKDIDYYETKGKDFEEFSEEQIDTLDYFLSLCDGILIPGGLKFTRYDMTIIELAIKKNMPILGICLGMQALSSYRRVKEKNLSLIDSNINHKELEKEYAHEVTIEKNTRLYQIIQEDKIKVNSFHTMQTSPNPHFKISAKSSDGVIEAIEMEEKNFVIGVQWHPEKLLETDGPSRRLMQEFIKESNLFKKNKKAKIVKL